MTILPNMLCAELRSAGVAIDQELQPAEKPVTRKILSFDSGSAELEEGEIVQPTTEAKIPAESTEVAAMLSKATTQMELEHKGQLVSQQKAFDEQVQVFTQRSAELEKRIENRVGAVEHKLGSFDIQFHQMQQMQMQFQQMQQEILRRLPPSPAYPQIQGMPPGMMQQSMISQQVHSQQGMMYQHMTQPQMSQQYCIAPENTQYSQAISDSSHIMPGGSSVSSSEVAQLSQQSQQSQPDDSQAGSQVDDERMAAEWQQQVNDEKRNQDPKRNSPSKPEIELVVKTVDPKPAVRTTRASRSREVSPAKDSDVPVESPTKRRKADDAGSARPVRGSQKSRGPNAKA